MVAVGTYGFTAKFDAWNRLAQVSVPSSTPGGAPVLFAEYDYDGRGYRIASKSFSGGILSSTRHYYYSNSWQVLEERLNTETTANRQFVWGLRYIDDLILRDRSVTGTLDERLYALQDGNWNVTTVVNTSGAVQERYEYDPYGQLTTLTPTFTARSASDFDWETTYCGYRWDSGTALYAVRHRYYSPLVGTWLSRDPIGYAGGVNPFAYCMARPMQFTDTYGLATTTCTGVGGGFTFAMGGSFSVLLCTDSCGNWAYIYNVRPSIGAGLGIGGTGGSYNVSLSDFLSGMYLDIEFTALSVEIGGEVNARDLNDYGGHVTLPLVNWSLPNFGVNGTAGMNLSFLVSESSTKLQQLFGPLADLSHPCPPQDSPEVLPSTPSRPPCPSPTPAPPCDLCCIYSQGLEPNSIEFWDCVDYCANSGEGCEGWQGDGCGVN